MAEGGELKIDEELKININLLAMHGNVRDPTTIEPEPLLPCIVRVPQFLKDLNPKAYVPQLVGLGPYHHCFNSKNANINLRSHKHKALGRSMQWEEQLKNDPQAFVNKLQDCVSPLRTEIQRFYSEDIEFAADVFILDAVFLLQLCFSYNENKPSDGLHPLLDYRTLRTCVGHVVRNDLFKLENQIPLRILLSLVTDKGMFECPPSSRDIAEWFDFKLIVELFPIKVGLENLWTITMKDPQPRHLIECVHGCIVDSIRCRNQSKSIASSPGDSQRRIRRLWKCCVKKCSLGKRKEEKQDDDCSIPTAKELEKVGISIHVSNKLWFKEEGFCRKGHLHLPKVVLDDNSEVMLRNMMAYEEFCVKPGERFFNRYMVLMTNLIQTHTDAAILIKQGVIQNLLENNESVARLFNDLNKYITSDEIPEIDEQIVKRVKAYYNSSLRVMLNDFIQTNFPNPWQTCATVAALVILVCTVVQAVFAVLTARH